MNKYRHIQNQILYCQHTNQIPSHIFSVRCNLEIVTIKQSYRGIYLFFMVEQIRGEVRAGAYRGGILMRCGVNIEYYSLG